MTGSTPRTARTTPDGATTAAGAPVRDGAALLVCAAGGAGGLVTKTISRTAAQPTTPNMAEISHGFLNAELWSEPGWPGALLWATPG